MGRWMDTLAEAERRLMAERPPEPSHKGDVVYAAEHMLDVPRSRFVAWMIERGKLSDQRGDE